MANTINDPVIGKLKKSANGNRYEGSWELTPGQRVEILVHLDKAERLPVEFQNFLGLLKTKDAEFRRIAAENLIELYNDTWSERGEGISEEDFAGQIEMESVSFGEGDGSVSVYYDDADLFAGHGIKVKAALDGSVLSANLP